MWLEHDPSSLVEGSDQAVESVPLPSRSASSISCDSISGESELSMSVSTMINFSGVIAEDTVGEVSL